MIDKDRLIELTKIAKEYADIPGFISLKSSFAGADLALTSLVGHLRLFHDLNDDEMLGCIIAKKFIERLEDNAK